MLHGNKILAVVPARGGSKGIKLKNLRKINGVPLVALAGKILTSIDWIDRAVVSTDHEEIKAVALQSGLEAPFMRPENISGDRIGDLEVLTHALLATEHDNGIQYDIILMIQPTCPFRREKHVMRTVEKLISGHYDAVWTVSETDSKVHPLKQLTIRDDQLDYYDEQGAKIIARQQLEPLYHRNGAAYAITRDCLLKKKSIKGLNTSAIVVEEFLPNIDTELDIEYAEFLLCRSTGK